MGKTQHAAVPAARNATDPPAIPSGAPHILQQGVGCEAEVETCTQKLRLDLAEIEWDDIDHDFGSGSRFETMRLSRKRK